ncbi:MAG TPA: cytochrome c3 family protein [Nitrospirota bacterium]|nr:cytochrome c3 family protein [Nitrospirota bacterium]
MNKEKSARRYLRARCCLFALFIVFLSGCTGTLKAHDLSASIQSFPSTSLTGTDLTAKCLECHDYSGNHHPIGIVPSHPANYPFPLYNGKIMCLTCHIEDHLGSAKLLREGPYADRRELCFKCHTEEQYAKINPHIMLNGRGKVLSVAGRPVCLFCHPIEPDPATNRTEDVVFIADVAFLCWRCHPPMANHMFFEEHFLATPTMEMRRFMEKQEQQLHVNIPLVPRDRITCSTCHNPHQKGVILYGPSASGADAPYRLRLSADRICIACHNIM